MAEYHIRTTRWLGDGYAYACGRTTLGIMRESSPSTTLNSWFVDDLQEFDPCLKQFCPDCIEAIKEEHDNPHR